MNIIIRAWLTEIQKIHLAGNLVSILNGQVNVYNSGLKRHRVLTVSGSISSGRIGHNELAFCRVTPCCSLSTEMSAWESIEMVRRYAHLAPNHLTEHARQIDAIFGSRVPNLSHGKFWRLKEVVKWLILFGTLQDWIITNNLLFNNIIYRFQNHTYPQRYPQMFLWHLILTVFHPPQAHSTHCITR